MKAFIVAAVVFASACWCGVYGEETTTAPNPCAKKFREDIMRVNVSETCVSKAGLKPEDLPHSEAEFVKNFNDKCYGKCLLTELGMLKGLTFDRDAIKADILDHVIDTDFQSQITAYTMKCLDEAESSSGALTEDNVCKTSAQLLYCCKKQEQMLKC